MTTVIKSSYGDDFVPLESVLAFSILPCQWRTVERTGDRNPVFFALDVLLEGDRRVRIGRAKSAVTLRWAIRRFYVELVERRNRERKLAIRITETAWIVNFNAIINSLERR